MIHAEGAATFFNRTYDETMDLIIEARDYLSNAENRERHGLAPSERLSMSCETMRVTSRLTQIMAWLLVRKAVHAGEMTEDQAAQEEYRLAGHMVCNDVSAESDAYMPRHLKSLLQRSYHLYARVSRLDQLIDVEHVKGQEAWMTKPEGDTQSLPN